MNLKNFIIKLQNNLQSQLKGAKLEDEVCKKSCFV